MLFNNTLIFVILIISSLTICNSAAVCNNCVDLNTCVHFLGKYYNLTTWLLIKKQVQCIHKYGMWKQDSTVKFESVQDSSGFGYADEFCENVKKGKAWQYTYVPSPAKCRIKSSPLSTRNMCQKMKGFGNIYIIGDSMNFQFFISFVNMLQWDFFKGRGDQFEQFSREDKKNKYSPFYRHAIEVLCERYDPGLPNFNLTYIRSDRLDLFLDKEAARKASIYLPPRFGTIEHFHEYDYIEDLRRNPKSLVVFNRGAHYIQTPRVLQDLRETFTYLTNNFADLTIVWRTTASGHVTEPETTFYDPPLLYAPDYIELQNTDEFNYENFEAQNVEVTKMLSFEFPQILVSDVYHSTLLRTDSRDDYLHFCIPGPTNEWVKLLYNTLVRPDEHQSYQSSEQCLLSTHKGSGSQSRQGRAGKRKKGAKAKGGRS